MIDDRALRALAEQQHGLSERFHTSLVDRQLDATRVSRLEAAGFVVLQISDEEIWHRAPAVVDAVRRGRAEAARVSGRRRPT